MGKTYVVKITTHAQEPISAGRNPFLSVETHFGRKKPIPAQRTPLSKQSPLFPARAPHYWPDSFPKLIPKPLLFCLDFLKKARYNMCNRLPIISENGVGILASIKDVSKHAGVSVATVSRVLNNKGYVSEETRKKVEQAIETLDYKPNEVARSLFKKQSKTIGLMVPTIMNPFFPELARAVEDVASTLGYNIILCNTDDNPKKEQHYLDVLLQKYVDGIIVSSNNFKAEQIEKLSIPVVCVDREISKNIPTVIVDNTKGAQIATQFLLDQGRKRIGHIKGPSHILNAAERYEGYLKVVGAADWFESSYVVDGHYIMESAIEGTKKLLHLHPEIDGIFAANDTMAIGAIKAINQLGYHIPKDIAVIGFDGISLGKATIPELTTIAQPIYQLGEKAATMLVQLIEGQSTIDRVYHVLGLQLVERQST